MADIHKILSNSGPYIAKDGSLGIVTTSPSTVLHIDQPSNDRAGGLYLETQGQNYGLSAFVNSGGYGVIGSNGIYTTDILTMDLNNGYVGMGIAPTSNQRLTLAEADANGSHIKMNNSRSGGGYWVNGVGDSASSSSIVPAGGIFWYNGATRMVINSSGNVGIGTTAPAYKVEINDDTANGRAIQAVQSATSGTNYGFQGGAYGVGATKNIGLHITAEGATTNVAGVFIGDVGIGTTSPLGKLDIQYDMDVNTGGITTLTSGTTQYGSINFSGVTDQSAGATGTTMQGLTWQVNDYNGTTDYGVQAQLVVGNNGSVGTFMGFFTSANYSAAPNERLRITSGGDIGIGTTSPSQKLDVQGSQLLNGSLYLINTNTRISSDANGEVGINYGSANTSTYSLSIYNSTTRAIGLGRTGDAYFSGDVGIGTASPAHTLDIQKSGDNLMALTGVVSGGVSSIEMRQSRGSLSSPSNSSANGDGNYIISQIYRDSGYNTAGHIGIVTGATTDDGEIRFSTALSGTVSEKMRIDENGHVGIGTASPAQKLHVDGALKLTSNPSVTGDGSSVHFWNQSGVGATIAAANFQVKTNGNTNALYINSSQNATFEGNITAPLGIITGTDLVANKPAGGLLQLQRDDDSIAINNRIGTIEFQGDDPTDGTFNTGAMIFANAAGTWDTNDYPTKLFFQTDNAGTLTTALTLDDSQNAAFTGEVFTEQYFETDSGQLLSLNEDSWSSGNQSHYVLYNGWRGNTGDYLLVKSSGNQSGGNGAILIADGGKVYFGKHANASLAVDSATAPLDTTYAYIGDTATYFSSDTTFAGNVTVSKDGYQLRLKRADGADDDWRFYSWASGLNIYSQTASTIFFGRDGQTADVNVWNGDFTVTSGKIHVGSGAPNGFIDVHADNGNWRVNSYGAMYFRNSSNATHESYIHSRSDGSLSIGRVAESDWTGSGAGAYAATTYDHVTFDTSSNATFAGKIIAGDSGGTNGSVLLQQTYSGNDIISTIGTMYSSGGLILGYGIAPKSGSSGFISTADNANFQRAYMLLDNNEFTIGYAAAQTTTVGSDITGLTTPFTLDITSGNATFKGNIHLDTLGTMISFYGNSSEDHAIVSKSLTGAADDDIRINSYGGVFINLDSNGNNDNSADFKIVRHSSTGAVSASDTLFTLRHEDAYATFAGDVQVDGNLTVEGDEFTLGTGNYEKVLFNTSPSSVLGNGTMEIQPQTIPGSGTAQFTSYFKKNAGTGTTQHNIKVDGKATIGGNIKLESGTGGTTDKIIFKTTDNADESKFIRTNSYWNEYGAHRNEGHKFIDSNSNILLQLNGDNSTTGNGALSATFAGTVNATRFILPSTGTTTPVNQYLFTNNTNAAGGKLIIQSGAGSSGYGGAINLFSHSHSTKPGWVTAGISSGSGGKFSVNTQGLAGGTDVFTVDTSGNATFAGDITLDDNSGASPSLYLYNEDNNYWRIFNGSSLDLTFRVGTVTKFSIDSSGDATFAGDITLADGWTLQNVSGGYAKFSSWVNVSNTGLYTTEDMYFDLDDSSSRFVVRGVGNAELFEIDTSDSNSATFAGNVIINGEAQLVSNLTTDNTVIYENDNGTRWQWGSKALTATNKFGGRYHSGSGWSSLLWSISTSGNVSIAGALSKGSGSFKIDHPLESKRDTHNLVHSFIEGPQADLIYRGKVDLVDGQAEVNIDTAAGMTEGTFVLLNTNVQCFTTNESNWDLVKGSVSGNILTIESQNTSSTATISWMVVGERQDQHMIDTDWTDDNGKIIVEPRKVE